MSRQGYETDKSLESELLRNLALMTPEARDELVRLAEAYTELFPLRPALRLVKSATGGGK